MGIGGMSNGYGDEYAVCQHVERSVRRTGQLGGFSRLPGGGILYTVPGWRGFTGTCAGASARAQVGGRAFLDTRRMSVTGASGGRFPGVASCPGVVASPAWALRLARGAAVGFAGEGGGEVRGTVRLEVARVGRRGISCPSIFHTGPPVGTGSRARGSAGRVGRGAKVGGRGPPCRADGSPGPGPGADSISHQVEPARVDVGSRQFEPE
jgi:hypothetical protein